MSAAARALLPRAAVFVAGGVLLAVLLGGALRAWVVEAVTVASGSMAPGIVAGDVLLVDKLSPVGRGDVVVFADPGGWAAADAAAHGGDAAAARLVKRVIGVGGDRVSCCADGLAVNGEPVDERYLFPGDAPSEWSFDVVVPDGRIWVMGDHRSASRDSRAHPAEPFPSLDEVVGIVRVRF